MQLTQDCPPGTQVFFDNFFASIELLIEMKKRQLGATATFRVARTGNCTLKGEKTQKKERRGAMDFRTEKDSQVVICTWNDNRSVTVGSNVHSVEPLDTCTRYERKTKTYVNVERPNLVRVSNESMGGVDKAEMLLSFYRNDLKTIKWHKRVLFHLIDLSVTNAWLLYREAKSADLHLADFKLQVALGLMHSQEGMPVCNEDCVEPTLAKASSSTRATEG